ncbi:hypothetical protein GALMADRAFT_234166 [Galerina marginata CBS 339.88]|uniref:Uncharacterized protein n=1 Tax=Galerina marginata (strain CBS 339.88) TaxID=685588 RepID=A0A067TZ91_GALM3|nr:hypothetical protein GALMADRAFT_234166 [Galerina marginata CBS 339.88]
MSDVRSLFALHPLSPRLSEYIASLSGAASLEPVFPEVKSYSDAVYFNYYPLGLSILFSPKGGYKPSTGLKLADLKHDSLSLDSIILYNVPKKSEDRTKGTSSRAAELAFATYPIFPIKFTIDATAKDKDGKEVLRPPDLEILLDTSGKDFVQALGEPDRKGGGAGPSSGSIGIWCEWSKDGIMVEFGGDEAKGPQAWERGKDAVWKIITVFPPT